MIQMVHSARRYVGTPVVHRGRTAGGMDCYGLLSVVLADCGVSAPSLTYGKHPDLGLFDKWLPEYCVRVADPQPSDIARLSIAGRAQHLAIVGDYPSGLSLIHAFGKFVCEHRLDAKWARRVHSFWRIC